MHSTKFCTTINKPRQHGGRNITERSLVEVLKSSIQDWLHFIWFEQMCFVIFGFCVLHTLHLSMLFRLNRCSLTQRCCEALASVLSSPSSHLRGLDLSDNDIEDSGVELLSTGLGNVCCKLEILGYPFKKTIDTCLISTSRSGWILSLCHRLSFCNITEKGCGFLASAVKSNPSHLSELDLSYNHLGKSGVKLISEALEEGRCELTKLR